MNNVELFTHFYQREELDSMLSIFKQASQEERVIMLESHNFEPLFSWFRKTDLSWFSRLMVMLELLEPSYLLTPPCLLLTDWLKKDTGLLSNILRYVNKNNISKKLSDAIINFYTNHLKEQENKKLDSVFFRGMVDYLTEQQLIEIIEILGEKQFDLIAEALKIDVVAFYEKIPPLKRALFIQSLTPQYFVALVCKQSIKVISFLFEKMSESQSMTLLEYDHYRACRELIQRRSLFVAAYLLEKMTRIQKEKLFNTLKDEICHLIQKFSDLRDNKLLDLIVLHATHCNIRKIITYNSLFNYTRSNYFFYNNAIVDNKYDILQHLLLHTNEKQRKEIIAAEKFRAIREAARNNQVEILRLVLSFMSEDEINLLINAQDEQNDMLTSAIEQNNAGVLDVILSNISPQAREDVIVANNFFLFRHSVELDRPLFLKLLLKYATNNQKIEMLCLSEGGYFIRAISRGSPETISMLISNVPYVWQDKMIASYDYYAVKEALSRDDKTLLLILLSVPATFDYMLDNFDDLPLGIDQIVSYKIAELKVSGFLNNYCHTEQERLFQLCFQLAKYSITTGSEQAFNDFLDLFDYPLLRERVAIYGNKLFETSVRYQNADAQHFLLSFESVREYIQYPDQKERTYLHALTSNKESSMDPLLKEEEAQLKQAIDYYAPQIKEKGVLRILDEARDFLKTRYLKQPAIFEDRAGNSIVLPSEAGELQLLLTKYDEHDRSKIFQKYCGHETHTLYRFLMENNLWLASNAQHVKTTQEGYRQSLFMEYADLIAMFFLAAKDHRFDGYDGVRTADRITLWITLMGDIARAHNRENTGAGCAIDNMLPDNPSCLAGIKKRLLASIIAHPLFKIVTKALIDAYVTEFQLDYFKKFITEKNAQELLDALLSCEEYPLEKDINVLKKMNIPLIKKQELVQYLNSLFSEQFQINPTLKQYLENRLSSSAHIDCDAIEFGGALKLKDLLQKKVVRVAYQYSGGLMFSNKKNMSQSEKNQP